MTATKKDLDGVINWTKEYFQNAGIEKAVVGLSGGIDSAVTAAVCVRALGAKNVIGVVMPCGGAFMDEDLGYTLAHNLKIKVCHFDLEEVFDKMWKKYREEIYTLSNVFPRSSNKLTPANLKARLRMSQLYMVAGDIGGLVVGTTNKTEAAIGYATKYGDHGVDIEPLQDFHKSEIYELAELLNKTTDAGMLCIPVDIIRRAPSAGLWDGQTDEGELGMTYGEIEMYLDWKEDGMPSEEPLRAHQMNKLDSLCKAAKHKENPNMPFYSRAA